MFQVNDRVRRLYYSDPYSMEGTVIDINGKWITVKHDFGDKRSGTFGGIAPRFDYLAEDLEHLDPLIRLAHALGPYDRSVP